MFRTLIAAAAIYTCGHPALDGYRPTVLDKPLQGFYGDVNVAARDGRRALAVLDDARAMRYLNVFIQRIDAELRSKQ